MSGGGEADRLRNQLLGLLGEDAQNIQRLVERLDTLIRDPGIGPFSGLMMILSHLKFSEAEARGHWEAIVAHHEELTSSLGRQVGIRTAALDYFMNINRRLLKPSLIDVEMAPALDEAEPLDRLTGLVTPRTFQTAVEREIRRARRYNQRASVVLFDLDNFRELNRQVGTLIGDRVLREAAAVLMKTCRDIDRAGRPGEDEFAVLLPETDRDSAILVAERFRSELALHFKRRPGEPIELTVSGGLACFPADGNNAAALIERAAQALYQAKASGKNQIAAFQEERRQYIRFDLAPGRFEVEVLTGSASVPTPRNLSRSGILFTSAEPLNVGEEIEIRLAHPDADAVVRAIQLRGRVVRLEELPEPQPVSSDVGMDSAMLDDRYEIGVAFDLTHSSMDPLSFLFRHGTSDSSATSEFWP